MNINSFIGLTVNFVSLNGLTIFVFVDNVGCLSIWCVSDINIFWISTISYRFSCYACNCWSISINRWCSEWSPISSWPSTISYFTSNFVNYSISVDLRILSSWSSFVTSIKFNFSLCFSYYICKLTTFANFVVWIILLQLLYTSLS